MEINKRKMEDKYINTIDYLNQQLKLFKYIKVEAEISCEGHSNDSLYLQYSISNFLEDKVYTGRYINVCFNFDIMDEKKTEILRNKLKEQLSELKEGTIFTPMQLLSCAIEDEYKLNKSAEIEVQNDTGDLGELLYSHFNDSQISKVSTFGKYNDILKTEGIKSSKDLIDLIIEITRS